MPACPACGRDNPEDARFCMACGAPLASEPAARREERKVVTVLFADLVGFTSRAEQLDPEDVRALLSGYHERVRFELERYGGTVEKFIGDAVMALFGAPIAREDDPERGVRAALAVREAIADLNEQDAARDLHVRIGITTGEALVRLDARPEEGEGMAAGDVVNTAARLQSAAPTDGILVDETTERATERAIEYRAVDPIDAKGKEAPVVAYEAVQPRSRYGVDVRQIGRTPLVGRQAELATLQAALRQAWDEREPRLVTVVGVPGIGKSRLVYELFGGLQAAPELITWRQGRSLPYGEGVSYWGLSEMVKAQAGILESDSEVEAAAKLRGAVDNLVSDERDAAWVERNLRPLVGLAEDAELAGDRRGEAFAAWRRFFEALADVRPLVLVFEDLHFADDGLLDFVDYLVDWARGTPLLVVGTSRPELLTRRPGWGGGKANAVTLSLQALSDTETAQLVHTLLDQPVLDADVRQQLVERAEGNPLYAEEFARLVAEGRRPELLPESVQGIVGARLDALTQDEKQRLQDAAVVGKVFWLGAVAAIAGAEARPVEELLHSLERKEFVRRDRRSSVEGETEYAFRHLVVRDVAYGQIPRAARAEKHRAMAEWLDGVGRTEDHAEMLAHHYLAALELGRAAGLDSSPLAGRAHRAMREAGDRAFGLYAFPAAARFYGEAIGLVDNPDPELLFRRAEALYRSGSPEGASALEAARDALLASGRSEQAAEAEALLAESWWHRGNRDRCSEHLARAEELVRGKTPSRAQASVLSQVARYTALAGDADLALSAGQRALAIAEELGLAELRARALNNVSLAKHQVGDVAGSIEDVERSIEIALAVNSPEAARGLNNLSVYRFVAGDNPEALRLREESMRAAERLGDQRQTDYTRAALPLHLYLAGRWDEAVRLEEEVLGASASETSYAENFVRRSRALIQHARGDDRPALVEIRRAVEIARVARDPQVVLPTLGLWLRVVVEQEIEDETERALAELLPELAQHASTPEVWLAIDIFWAAAESARLDDFRRMFGPREPKYPWSMVGWAILDADYVDAADRLATMGDVADEAFARLCAAEQFVTQGRRRQADDQLQQALAFFRSVGATRYVRRGEALLAASA
jgi:class 3 adenylate cyclase